MTKICKLSDEKYRDKLIKTLSIIADTVSSTLGPNGKTCMLYDGDVIPHVTKDGVTVAEFIKFKDAFQEAINKIVKETARKTGETVGDGTTTSILLACTLAVKILEQEGKILDRLYNAEEAINQVIKQLKNMTVQVDVFHSETIDILQSIIFLSSNGDKEITKIITDILNEIGADSLIDVTISYNEITHVDIKEGMLIEAPAHVNKVINLPKPVVVLVSTSIEKGHQIKTCMQLALTLLKDTGRSMIIVAKEFSKEVQDIVTVNNRSNRTSIFLVESDGFALNMFDVLDDMASLLNCKILSTDSSSEFGLQNITMDHVSIIVTSAIVTPQHTVLQSDKFLTPENLEIKNFLLSEISSLKTAGENKLGELKKLQKRLSKFSKSATIYISGFTESEKLEKKDRVDDAVRAMAAAINGGIVPGGGYALYKASRNCNSDIVKSVCELPATLLSQGTNIMNIFEIFDKDMVMDYATEEIGDPFSLGVLDPADVAIKALQQAMVIVKLILNTHSIIIPDDGEI